jgi:diguanylate cyclase (GGDEF)-like protein
MPAVVPQPRVLAALAACSYALVFALFVRYAEPGFGMGHFFYVAIVLLAMAYGTRAGAAAGLLATTLYVAAVLLNSHLPDDHVLSIGTGIRLVSFVVTGLLLGWFAERNRALTAELRVLAERDHLTGLPNARSFEAAIDRRLDAGEPFALFLGDMDGLKLMNDEEGLEGGNDALRRLADVLAGSLRPEDEVARVGGDEFAVLASSTSADGAAQLCTRLEWVLAAADCQITFGWAVHPQEGTNALSLYRVADERLYARKLVRGRRLGEAQTASR